MIERNTQNLIVWEEPDNDRLAVLPKRDMYDNAQIRNIFDVPISNELEQEDESSLFNADVRIDAEAGERDITLYLLVSGNPPYELRRDGEVIETEISPENFPYTDTPPEGGESCYVIEDFDSDTHEVCAKIPFVRELYISTNVPSSENGDSGLPAEESPAGGTETGDFWFLTREDIEKSTYEVQNVHLRNTVPSDVEGTIGDIWFSFKNGGQDEVFDIQEVFVEKNEPEEDDGDNHDIWTTEVNYD